MFENPPVVAGFALLGITLVGYAIARIAPPRLLFPGRIRLLTSSDWTTLCHLAGRKWSSATLVSSSEEAIVAEISDGCLRLTQAINRAQSGGTVEMVVDITFTNPDLLGDVVYQIRRALGFRSEVIELEIERGHLGWTHVQFSNLLNEEPIVVENYWWSSITPGDRNFHRIEISALSFFSLLPPDPPIAQDPRTLDEKVLFGYQGWFGCPGDGSDRNSWVHWFRRDNVPTAEKVTVDFWPDMQEYPSDERFETGMSLPNGGAAQVFSSYNQETVGRHFEWMEEYSIDGVFAQRFVTCLEPAVNLCFCNKVLQNVRMGAERHGRVFAVMYDITGAIGASDKIKGDWEFLTTVLRITDSPNYLRHNGKPVVGIWGYGFRRNYTTPAVASDLLEWFHTGAPEGIRATVVGGVPSGWRTLTGESRIHPDWAAIYRSYDVISPWTVGRYSDNPGADAYRENTMIPDLADASASGVEYMPVIWPGFSSHNLYPTSETNQIPRNGGSFLLQQAYNAISATARTIYVAMFDEVDEGTAMFKLATRNEQLPVGAPFVPLNVDGYNLFSDHYLRLGGQIGQMLRGDLPLSGYRTDGGWTDQGHSIATVPALPRPGLAGFRFDSFITASSGDPSAVDHHIRNVEVKVFQNQINVGYHDEDEDDMYRWIVDRQELPPGTTFHEVEVFSESGSGLYKRIAGAGEFDGIPALTGFWLNWADDHHLDLIEARVFVDGFCQLAVEVIYQDEGKNHPFSAKVNYALVPADRVRACGYLGGGPTTKSDSKPIYAMHPVLQGFKLDFKGDDHHIDELGVRLSPTEVSVWYNDKNDDDRFSWTVWWVDVE